ncbi:hypothetical protein BDZ91DRAFT_723547 [Kalaharituber pfeilii]|nr:hypothetical protein BDZ91DRAFT_723547 [Kalaharituber pfeilii]
MPPKDKKGCQPAPPAALQRHGYQHVFLGHNSALLLSRCTYPQYTPFVHSFPQSRCNTYTPFPLYIASRHNSIKSKARRGL